MTIRDLLAAVKMHAHNGRYLDVEVLVRVGREYRSVEASYVNGAFILIAGDPVER